MNDDTIVEIEPSIHHRSGVRNRSNSRLKKAELSDIVAAETMILATAVGQVVLSGLEMKERRKMRRILLLIVGGLVLLTGLTRMAIILLQH